MTLPGLLHPPPVPSPFVQGDGESLERVSRPGRFFNPIDETYFHSRGIPSQISLWAVDGGHGSGQSIYADTGITSRDLRASLRDYFQRTTKNKHEYIVFH